MVSNVAVIAEYRGLIMGDMRTKQNVPSAAMFMVQMGPMCSKGAAQKAREGNRRSCIGRLQKNKVIQTQRNKTEPYPSCQNESEN
jgi:hypothetical protein